MTVEEKVKQLLLNSMTEEQVDDALEFFKKDERGNAMRIHWSDAAEDYSMPVLVGLASYIKAIVPKTIEKGLKT